ncbi:MAG: HEAT repeat domain-containing protein, partial [Acidimicrobiia bacterium]
QGVLRSSERQKDFEDTLGLVVESVERAVREGNRTRYSRLIELLVREAGSHSDESRRRRIEDSISTIASTELIGDLLKQPAAESDPLIARILEMLGGHVVHTLVTLLADEVDRTRRKALIEMLIATAPSNPHPVIQGLNDPRWYVVRNFAMILGRIRSSEAVPALEKLMQFGDPRVRREAVRAGATTQGPAALPKLIQSLSDADEVVRLQSLAAIGAIQDLASTESLIQFASRRGRSIAEMKEVLTSLQFQRNQQATEFLKKTSLRRWPPTSATRQLAKFSKGLLARGWSPSTGPDYPVEPDVE